MRGCLQMAKESYGTSIDHQLWVFFSFPPKFSAPPTYFPWFSEDRGGHRAQHLLFHRCVDGHRLLRLALHAELRCRHGRVPPSRGGAADAGADTGASAAAATATKRCHAESLEGGDRCGFWLAFLGEIPEGWMLGKASWWKYQMVNDSKKKIRRFGSRILGWVYNNESDDYRIQLSWVTLDCWSNSPAGMTGHRHARHHQAS